MKSPVFGKIIRGFILTLICFTALTHGAVEGWSQTVFMLLTGLALLVWCGKWLAEKEISIKADPLYLPLFGFTALGYLQWIDLGFFGLGRESLASPEAVASISFDREATLLAAFLLLHLSIAFVLARNFLSGDEIRNFFFRCLIVFGAVVAVLSIIQMAAGNGLFFRYRPGVLRQGGGGQWLTGPFVNHNHLAGYLELLIAPAFAYLVTKADERINLLYGFAFLIMAIALFLTASRGGLIGFSAGFLWCLIARYLFVRRQNRQIDLSGVKPENPSQTEIMAKKASLPPAPSYLPGAVLTIVLIFGFIAGTLWLGIGPAVERVAETEVFSDAETAQTFEGSRGWIWRNSLSMFRENKFFGVGLGAYAAAFPVYASSDGVREFGSKYLIDRAHNDYLQLLVDTGLAGGLCGAAFFLLLITVSVKVIRTRDRQKIAPAIGLTGGMISLLVHSAFDFNLQIPSTSLLFLVYAGAAAALAGEKKG